MPYTLRGKRLIKGRLALHVEEALEKYLESGEMEYFYAAVKKDNKLLLEAGCGRDLTLEEVLRKKPSHKNYQSDSIYVDPLTIVGEVIRALQSKCVFRLGEVIRTSQGSNYKIDKKVTEKVTKEPKKYLKRISPLLVPERKAHEFFSIGDGLVHVTPKEEGKHPYLKYESAENFILYWNHVEEAFKGKEKRYKTITQPLLEEMREEGIEGIAHAIIVRTETENLPKIRDIKKIIQKKLGDEISEDELKRFNLEDIATITASYIAWKHAKACPVCKEQVEKSKEKAKKANKIFKESKVGYKTIQRLYTKAREELEETY